MKKLMKVFSLTTSIILFSTSALASELGYYRYPSMLGETIVFTADGDLWKKNLSSQSEAVRLTSHASIETHAKISPDGGKLAFIADYNGIDAIFVMPMSGGKSEQASYENRPVRLHGWSSEESIIYSTQSETGMHNSWVLKTLNTVSGKVSTLPLSDAVQGTLDTNSEWLYFTQFGLQISGDNAAHYKGGGAGEIWKFNTKQNSEAILLTENHQGSVHSPMLHNDRLYFISNQNGIDNLWSMAVDGTGFTQHTAFDDFAMRGASISGSKIVFQHGADIKLYDTTTSKTESININLLSDFPQLQPRIIEKPLNHFSQVSVAPDGKKAAVIARGELAIAFPGEQRLVSIAKPGHARFRNPVISADGKSVYVISDQTGEYEIWQFPADGSPTGTQITDNGSILRTDMKLSPNGEHLINSDKSGNVFLLNTKNKRNQLILSDVSSGISDLSFSHDSRYFAAGIRQKPNERSRIFIYDIKEKEGRFVTTDKYISYSPSFSHDGHWLYFLSDRSFTATPGSPWGDRNMGTMFDKRTQIFAISLSGNTDFPFAPASEIDPVSEEKAKLKWEGIGSRLWKLDIDASNFNKVLLTEKHLFVLDEEELLAIEIKRDTEAKTITGGVQEIQISDDGKQLLIQKGQRGSTQLMLIPAKSKMPDNSDEYVLNLKNWRMQLDPKKEFTQIFNDAWLMHRDSFYDANMRGVDWKASRDRYLPLLSKVTERSEVNDIFMQMMGELNSLHSQVRGGDLETSDNALGLTSIGAVLEDTDDGVVISHIFAHDVEIIEQAPPISMPGVDAKQGDIIKAINGMPVTTVKEVQKLLMNQVELQVLFTLQRGRKAHQTIIVPEDARNEPFFRYQDWTARNYQRVQSASKDIGYIHLYAMGRNDLARFAREFYSQYKKPGLIIDVRRNRGGNIDSIILEKLLRRVWSFWQTPNGDQWLNMQQTFRGHMVVLADQFTYSDGETFTAGIKALELAPVIGKQTAGAGVWLSGNNRLTDGGIARVAEFPVYSLDGDWITEARGISPDIEVDNLPYATFNGEDAQLATAIQLLQEKMRSQPIPELEAKPFPKVEDAAKDIK